MAGAWKIEKYARYLHTAGVDKGQWKQYDDSAGEMVLTVTESNFMLLCRGPTVMESHNLLTARAWMRALTKRDSMLIMYKIKNETRRFRLKFYGSEERSPEEACSHCAERLSDFFPVKIVNQPTVSHTDTGKVQEPEGGQEGDQVTCSGHVTTVLEGEVTLGTLAQVVTGATSRLPLPRAYQECHISSADMDLAIRLCLTDPTFPAFVQQLDQHLQKVMADTV